MPSKPEGGKKLERRSDDRLSAGQTHALLRQRTHRTAAIHSVEPSEAHTHKLEKAPFYNKRAQSLLKDGKFLKKFGKAFMRAKRATPRQASQVVAEGDGLRVYIFSFKEYSH